jgi:hypothetical protein
VSTDDLNDLDDAVGAWLDATDPRGEDVARVKRRLEAQAEVPGYDPVVLRLLAGPAEGAELRVRNRLAEGRQTARRPAMWILLPVGAAAAAALALMVPRGADAPSEAPRVVEAPLRTTPAPPASAGEPLTPGVERAIGAHVVVTSRGEGRIGGTAEAPRIAWTTGELSVQVEPNQGVDLEVATPDATVRVVGTVFSVDRGYLGTTIAVERGQVAVTCVDGTEHRIVGGAEAECWSTEPATLLARARGAKDPAVALLAAERGLPLASGGIADELRHARIQALIALDRTAEARAACDDYLAQPAAPRRAEVERIRDSLKTIENE